MIRALCWLALASTVVLAWLLSGLLLGDVSFSEQLIFGAGLWVFGWALLDHLLEHGYTWASDRLHREGALHGPIAALYLLGRLRKTNES